MRKLAAILLLSLFLFNWIGYRFLVDYMQDKADLRFELKLDKNKYDQSALVELKVPIHLPYQNTWSSYERYDGEIEIDGKLYKYVERKVSDDTLYLKCLPNPERMHLEKAKENYFLHVNDLAQHDNNKQDHSKTLTFKKLIGDFTEMDQQWSSAIPSLEVGKSFLPLQVRLSTAPAQAPFLPPDLSIS